MVQTIGALLDKADRVYRQLVANKPVLEVRYSVREVYVQHQQQSTSTGQSQRRILGFKPRPPVWMTRSCPLSYYISSQYIP